MPFRFQKLSLDGPVVIVPDVHPDERGLFCELYKKSDFADSGIGGEFVQENLSYSRRRVLRGLHYQLPPFAQGKLVRAITGKVWDVAVDLRKASPSFGKWVGVELSDEDRRMLWIPPGFAHGFVALSSDVHLLYACTAEYKSAAERGVRWNDPDLAIDWPLLDVVVSKRDSELPPFNKAEVFQVIS